MQRFILGLALASMAFGCKNGEDTTDTTLDTAFEDSGSDAPKFLSAATAIVIASFAYDSANQQAVGFTEGTNTSKPGISLILFNSAWQGSLADDDNYCQANFEAAPPLDGAAWAASFPALGFAFDYGTLTFVGGDCEDKLDPVDFPDFNATMAATAWGVGVGKDMDADYRAQLAQCTTDLTNIMGGGFAGDVGQLLEDAGLVTAVLTNATAVDENFIVTFDDQSDPVTLGPDDAFDDQGVMQTGLYVVQLVLGVDVIEALF